MSMLRFFRDTGKHGFELPPMAGAGGNGADKPPGGGDNVAAGGEDKKTPEERRATFGLTETGTPRVVVSEVEQKINEDFLQILARNADALEERGLNAFSDKELLEQVYKELRSSQKERRAFDRAAVASDNEQKIQDAMEFFSDVLGGGDDPDSDAGALKTDEKDEEVQLREAA